MTSLDFNINDFRNMYFWPQKVVSQPIVEWLWAKQLEQYLLEPIPGGLAVESGGTSVEDGSFARLGISRI